MSFVEELTWRGMVQDKMPGLEEQLAKGMTAGYVGFDPTADSLHIGNLVPIMLLVHFQKHGHKPYALIGGATGMVGDPSGRSTERQFLDTETIQHNLDCQQKQLEHFLDFDSGENSAEIINNYDWFKDMGFLEFIREAGKHITVNYMMAKDSVKSRLESGLSFTEFTYQLIQGYDFYHLYKEKDCLVQMGGSDQWGNIVTGTELIRRKAQGEAFALTAPLIKKADGTKFGKSQGGNVWLDKKKTSPYKFYQYWLNAADDDIKNFIRVFSLKGKDEIEALEKEHDEAPHLRILQKTLAEELTIRIHGQQDLDAALAASNILFGKSTLEQLNQISEDDLLSVFEGVPQGEIASADLSSGLNIVDALSEQTGFLKSKGEAKRALKENSISVNKQKVTEEKMLTGDDLINGKYIILQRGKKNYFLSKVV
ncbi:MAG: tyrosine--tRNA ligase [Flavobacteriales bacterium]|nr:tyrosine--tRNA ligase [Flavobacteriales bacterium]